MTVLKKREMTRGVVVDMNGLVAGEVSWPAKGVPPNPNIIIRDTAGNVTRTIRRRLLTGKDLEGYRANSQRWDAKKKVWNNAPLKLYVVSTTTGALLSSFNTWPDMIPDLNPDLIPDMYPDMTPDLLPDLIFN